jgi:hypothetical protein
MTQAVGMGGWYLSDLVVKAIRSWETIQESMAESYKILSGE